VKRITIYLFLIFQFGELYSQIIDNTNILEWDNYHIDNDFLNSKDPKYVLFNGNYNDYIKNLKNVDIVFSKKNSERYWGVGSESVYNFVYYFDSNKKNKRFGYNYDTGQTYISQIGNAITTSNGLIYVVDDSTNEIVYWDINEEKFNPDGKIDFQFSKISDLCKNNDDEIFILDKVDKKVYLYKENISTVIDLNQYYNQEWGFPNSIEANKNGIYIIYEGGVIVQYGLDYKNQNYYWIDENNLGLKSSYRRSKSNTWLQSISSDPEGNIYVLDSKSLRVHIFTKDLKYIFSWNNIENGREITVDTNDITFYPNKNNFLLIFDWGFDVYKKK